MYSQMADNEFIKSFLCDTTEDIATLPTHDRAGCLAFVISTGSKYMLNHQSEWIRQPSETGGNEEVLMNEIEDLKLEIKALQDRIEKLENSEPKEDIVIEENAISFPEEAIEIKEETNSLILTDDAASEIIENALVLID